MGEGNNSLTLSSTAVSGSAYGLDDATVQSGGGADSVSIRAETAAAGELAAALNGSELVTGAGNDSVSHAQVQGDEAQLGDILGFGGDLSRSAAGIGGASQFEAPLVDFSDGASDSIDLDVLLSRLDSMNNRSANCVESLIIKGDTGGGSADIFTGFGSNGSVLAASGVGVAGVEGTFDRYTLTRDSGMELEIYIQTGLYSG